MPKPSKMVPISHVNQSFNDDIQADFTYVKIRESSYTAIHYVNTGTGYSGGGSVTDRKGARLVNYLDKLWIHHHGAPTYMSADEEFHRPCIIDVLNDR